MIYAGNASSGALTVLTTLTANGTISSWNTIQPVDTTNGTVVVTIPTSTSLNKGLFTTIKKVDNSNNPVKIIPNGTDLLDGISSGIIYLFSKGDAITFLSMSGDSKVISDNRNSTGVSANYLYAERTTVQTTNILATNQIIFTNVTKQIGSNISLNTTTGVVTLTGNSAYSIKTASGVVTGSNASITYNLEKSTDGTTWTAIGVQAVNASSDFSYNYGRETVAHYVLDISTTTYVRTTISSISGASGIGSVGMAMPWIEVEEVNKQATVINSADYISAYQSIVQNLTTANVNTILTIDTKTTGNLTLNSNNTVTLTAGKTYKLDGGVGYGGSAFDIAFYNVTTSTYLSSNSSYVQSTTSGSYSVHYTPTANCQVALAVRSVSSAGSEGYINGSRILGAWMTITQVGSSACTNVPWNVLPSDVSQSIVGEIKTYAGSVLPSGWLFCQGQAVSRTAFPNLFLAIGITYGAGDTTTTFNLPDLRGKIPVGYNTSDTDFNTLGKSAGEKSHVLTINEMPSHTHGIPVNTGIGTQAVSATSSQTYTNTYTTQPTGGGVAHNNMQPYIVMNYIIKY
jgi:microcystin-dependent protein